MNFQRVFATFYSRGVKRLPDERRPLARRLYHAIDLFAPLLSLVGIAILWEIACREFRIPEFLLPSPSSILEAGRNVSGGEWLSNITATMRVALMGYFVAIFISIPLAVALSISRILSRAVYPILVVIHSAPIVAIAPIVVVTLGLGDLSHVVITAIISFFPLVISTTTGLLSTPEEFIELSRSLGATKGREVVQIRLPYAVPHIFSALKISITLAIVGAVVAEFVSADHGLGYSILFATSTFKIPQAFASLVILVSISLVLFQLIVFIQEQLFSWSLPAKASEN